MKYGIGYKGSKNKLAENILALFPKRENFYDLFCGGGSITHCALVQDNFKHYYMNDINPMCTQLFLDAVHGKYRNETRWIDRETFNALKDKDPYIKYIWSFGNTGREYMYSREIEPYKKALHYAVIFKDYKLLNSLIPDNYSFLDPIKTSNERRLCLQQHIKNKRSAIGTPLESCANVGEILQSNNRLQNLEALQSLERLEVFNTTFENFQIKPDSIIYCDIPYQDTDGYTTDFNFENFFDWCKEQKELCFISSYKMPEDRFVEIASYKHRCTLSGTANNEVTERVFIPKHQVNLYRENQVQPSLFSDMW